jgi:hypothetical protein
MYNSLRLAVDVIAKGCEIDGSMVYAKKIRKGRIREEEDIVGASRDRHISRI